MDRARSAAPAAQSAQPLNLNRISIIPRPSPSQAQGFQLPDFYSGATDQLGRFTEGFSLRRLQASISLNLLPDFAALGDKQDPETEDERAQAVEMARATLEPLLGGGGSKATLKKGVLADALRAFARDGGGMLDDFISSLLSELPEEESKSATPRRWRPKSLISSGGGCDLGRDPDGGER